MPTVPYSYGFKLKQLSLAIVKCSYVFVGTIPAWTGNVEHRLTAGYTSNMFKTPDNRFKLKYVYLQEPLYMIILVANAFASGQRREITAVFAFVLSFFSMCKNDRRSLNQVVYILPQLLCEKSLKISTHKHWFYYLQIFIVTLGYSYRKPLALIENIDSRLGYKNLYIAKFNALYIKNIRLLQQNSKKLPVIAT